MKERLSFGENPQSDQEIIEQINTLKGNFKEAVSSNWREKKWADFEELFLIFTRFLKGREFSIQASKLGYEQIRKYFYRQPSDLLKDKEESIYYYLWNIRYFLHLAKTFNDSDLERRELALKFWWVGDENCQGDEIARNLKLISTFHLNQLPSHIKHMQGIDEEKRKRAINKALRVGNNFAGSSTEILTLDLQDTHWGKFGERPLFKRNATIWFSFLVDGSSKIKIVSYNNNHQEESLTFQFPSSRSFCVEDLISLSAKRINQLLKAGKRS